MKTTVWGFVAALLLATPAFAEISPEEMFGKAFDNLMGVVAEEQGNLEKVEKPGRDQKKALKAFTKARRMAGKLGDFGIDKRSLKRVGRIVKALEKVTDKSGGDQAKEVGLLLPAVQSAMSELVGAVRSIVATARQDAEDGQGALSVEKNVARVAKTIGRALARVDSADSLWTTRWAKAWANYIKAATTFDKATLSALKYLDKETLIGPFNSKSMCTKPIIPAGVRIDIDGQLVNESGKAIVLKDIHFNIRYKLPGQSEKVEYFRAGENSDTFPVHFDETPYSPLIWSSLWSGFQQIPNSTFRMCIVYETSIGLIGYPFQAFGTWPSGPAGRPPSVSPAPSAGIETENSSHSQLLRASSLIDSTNRAWPVGPLTEGTST